MPLNFQQLCKLFDTRQRAALVRVLKARGVAYMLDRKGRPVTTEDALNRAISPIKPLTFTKPPCRTTSRSRRTSTRKTAAGTMSTATNGGGYAG